MGANFAKIALGMNFKPQPTSAISSPSNGDVYYDSTRNTLVEYINGQWTDNQSRSDVTSASSMTSTLFTATIVQSTVVRVTGSTSGNIHGLVASSDAKAVLIYNQSSVLQTLKNQSTTETTAANRILTPSGADITLLSGQSATLIYDSSQSRWIVVGISSSGSGSGTKNYLSAITTSQSSTPNTGNGNFELGSTVGWSLGTIGTLTNGLPVGSPTFGSGASGNLSMSIVNSGQLAGMFSLSYASSAATTAGNMLASDAFDIDAEDQAKVLTWKFYYKAQTNPGNANWSGTSSNSFGVAVWDVTNSQWLGTTASFGMTQSSGVGSATGTVQTNLTTAQLRLVVYNVNATSGAVTLYFDDFTFGPQTVQVGVPITDWASYSTQSGIWSSAGTSPAIGNGSIEAAWRRSGKNMQVRIQILSGTTTTYGSSNGYNFSIPSGYSIDTTVVGSLTGVGIEGSANARNTSSLTFATGSVIPGDSPTQVSVAQTGGNNTRWNSTLPGTWTASAANQTITLDFEVPIVGWSSNTQMSNDTDTRVVAGRFTTSIARTINNTAPTIVYETVAYDTHGAYNSSTGVYTVPVSGTYRIQASRRDTSVSQTVGSEITNNLIINGASNCFLGDVRFQATSTNSQSVSGGTEISLKAGDTVSIGGYSDVSNTTVVALPSFNFWSISRISGPSVIAATESVNAGYSNASGQSIPANTVTIVTGWTKLWDTHAAFNGAGVFTVPVSGKYRVSVNFEYSQNAGVVTDEAAAVFCIQAGSVSRGIRLGSAYSQSTGTTPMSAGGSQTFNCLAGDTLSIGAYQNSGGAKTLIATDASFNNMSIERIGN